MDFYKQMLTKKTSRLSVASIVGGLRTISAINRSSMRIVFTNGCFDLLHQGHVEYLCKARNLGDCLVVGINTDASVRRLKGQGRPISPLKSRQMVLAALSCVDLVVPFSEDTPLELIKLVRPDVLVKGGDYSRETIVGADFVESYGGKVVTIPLVEGFSSTNLINKVKKN